MDFKSVISKLIGVFAVLTILTATAFAGNGVLIKNNPAVINEGQDLSFTVFVNAEDYDGICEVAVSVDEKIVFRNTYNNFLKKCNLKENTQIQVTVPFDELTPGKSNEIKAMIVEANSSIKNSIHIFEEEKKYNVTLTVEDNDTLSSTITKEIDLTVSEQPSMINIAPTADFDFVCDELTCVFADASTDSDGTIASYLWYFGDSTNSTTQNPTHTYSAEGTYNTILMITDNDGASALHIASVSIESNETNNTDVLPEADFTKTCEEYECEFSDNSDQQENISSRLWNFDDGTTSTAKNPTHTFANEDDYSVKLTVTYEDGTVSEVTKTVSVPVETEYYPEVDAGSNKEVETGEKVSFMGLAEDEDNNIVKYEWDFNYNSSKGFSPDYTSLTDGITEYTYNKPGAYKARFRVEDADDLEAYDDITVTVTGDEIPEDDITGSKTYSSTISNIDIIRKYSYDIEDEQTTIKLRITNTNSSKRNFYIREEIPASFVDDIDEIESVKPRYDYTMGSDEMVWNVTLDAYEDYTITYVFEGYMPLKDMKDDFETPRIIEYATNEIAEEQKETEQKTSLSDLTGFVLGAFTNPSYGTLFLIMVIILLVAIWQKPFINKKWAEWTE